MKNLTHYFKNNGTSPSSSTEDVGAPANEGAKRKKRRKVSDPAVEGLSSDKTVKKGKSLNSSADDFDCNKSAASEEIVVIEEQDTEIMDVDLKTKSPSTPKLNAFQFMMESRTKSIGRNSPGKEKPNETDDVSKSAKKERLSARKNLLQKWADKKGGLKRKRAEEETEEAIKTKLKKRTDRMKNLLSGEQQEEKKDVIKIKMFSPKKNLAKESGKKSNETARKRKKKKNRLSLSKEKVDDDTENTDVKGETIKIVDEDCKQTKTEQKEADLREETIKIDDGDFGKQKIKKDAKNRDLKNENENSEKETTNTENNDFNNTAIKIDDGDSKETKIEQEKEMIKIDDEDCGKAETKREAKEICLRKTEDEECKKTKTEPEEDDLKNEIIKIVDGDCEKEKTKGETEKNDLLKIEDANDLNQISANKKTRKIRLKSTNENETPSPPLRRSTRTKKPTKLHQDIVYVESESEILLVEEEETPKKTKGKRTVDENKKAVKLAPIFLKKLPKPVVDPKVEEAKRNFLYSGLPEVLKKAIDKQKW